MNAKINQIQSIIQSRIEASSTDILNPRIDQNAAITEKATKTPKVGKIIGPGGDLCPLGIIKAITGIKPSINQKANAILISNGVSIDKNLIKGSFNNGIKIVDEDLFDRDLPRKLRLQQKTTVASLDVQYIPINLQKKAVSPGGGFNFNEN